jgi:hypothetical protein
MSSGGGGGRDVLGRESLMGGELLAGVGRICWGEVDGLCLWWLRVGPGMGRWII